MIGCLGLQVISLLDNEYSTIADIEGLLTSTQESQKTRTDQMMIKMRTGTSLESRTTRTFARSRLTL